MTKAKPHRDDLLIGEDEWISFVQHDWGNVEWLYIDNLLEPLFPLFNLIETECVAQCCGIDAFSFFREDILAAASQLDRSVLEDSIKLAIDEIGKLNRDVLGSRRLNNGVDRGTMLKLLRHIREAIRDPRSN